MQRGRPNHPQGGAGASQMISLRRPTKIRDLIRTDDAANKKKVSAKFLPQPLQRDPCLSSTRAHVHKRSGGAQPIVTKGGGGCLANKIAVSPLIKNNTDHTGRMVRPKKKAAAKFLTQPLQRDPRQSLTRAHIHKHSGGRPNQKNATRGGRVPRKRNRCVVPY